MVNFKNTLLGAAFFSGFVFASDFQCFTYKKSSEVFSDGTTYLVPSIVFKVHQRSNGERVELLASVVATNEKVDELLSTLESNQMLCLKGRMNFTSGRTFYAYDANVK